MSTQADTRKRFPSTRALNLAGVLLVAVASTGCASYPERTQGALLSFESGSFEQARSSYADFDTTRCAFLSGAEAGMAAFCNGDWDGAIEYLGRAASVTEEIEREALLSPQNLSESLVSFAVSETASEYVGEGYERVMLHAHLALAYLAKGDFVAARVEVKQANALLETEEELYDKDYQAGGLGHLISAIVYELEGSPDDAYIDYKRLQAKGLGGGLVGRSLVRLATQLGRDDELPSWEERFGVDVERPDDAAEIVLIAGLGMGPVKRAKTLPIPTPDGLLQWSVPAFQGRAHPVGALELSVAGSGVAVETALIEDVARVSQENLDDRIGWLATRSAVRAVLKRELTKSLRKEYGAFGQLAGDLFTAITERADLRAWQTLPSSYHAARLWLAPGAHRVELRALGGASLDLGEFELIPGETMFILARTLGGRIFTHTVGGSPLPVELSEPEPILEPAVTTSEP